LNTKWLESHRRHPIWHWVIALVLCGALGLFLILQYGPIGYRPRTSLLRNAIDAEYRQILDRKDTDLVKNGVDVSAVIREFIPVGMSFKDAEKILTAAGFTLAPSPPRPPTPVVNPLLVNERFFIAGGLTLDSTFFSKTEISVRLIPDVQGSERACVKDMTAYLHSSYL
jgi:hypothetical protein